MSQHTTIESPRRPGPPLAVALPLLIGGVVAAVVGVAFFVSAFVSFANAPSFTTPQVVSMRLAAGTYVIYQERDGISANLALLTPSQVSVSSTQSAAPSSSVPVSEDSVRESYTFNGGSYVGALTFRAPTSGVYVVRVSSSSGRVVVAKSLVRVAESNLAWLGLVGLGGIAGVIGLVLLIVGVVRRSNAKKQQGGGWGPPQPGWGGYGSNPPAWGAPGGWPVPPGQPGAWPVPPGQPGAWGGPPAQQGGWPQPSPKPSASAQPPPEPGSPPPYT